MSEGERVRDKGDEREGVRAIREMSEGERESGG